MQSKIRPQRPVYGHKRSAGMFQLEFMWHFVLRILRRFGAQPLYDEKKELNQSNLKYNVDKWKNKCIQYIAVM